MRRRIYSPLLKSLAAMEPVTDSDDSLVEAFKNGDAEAGNKLFLKHYKIIVKIIIDTTNGRWYDDDCLHAGAMGLYEAALRFDPRLDYKFLTYAWHWIRKYVHIEVCNDALPMGGIFLGRDAKERLFRFISLKMVGYSDERIAETLKLSLQEVERLSVTALQISRPVSLTSIHNEEDEEQADFDMIGVPSIESAEETVVSEQSVRDIEALVRALPEESQFILNHTLEINGAPFKTKNELSKELRLSAQQYNTLKRNAYKELKLAMRNSMGTANG